MKERVERVSKYFNEISECLSDVASQLQKGEIPFEKGHYLKSLAEGLDIIIASNLAITSSIENEGWYENLRRAIVDADGADSNILLGKSSSNFQNIIPNIQRTAGDFKGLSLKITMVGDIPRNESDIGA